MNYLVVFLAVFVVLLLYWKLLIGWPKEHAEFLKVREACSAGQVFLGLLSPRRLRGKISEEEFGIFVKFRRRVLLFWFSVLLVVIAYWLYSNHQFQSQLEAFEDKIKIDP